MLEIFAYIVMLHSKNRYKQYSHRLGSNKW